MITNQVVAPMDEPWSQRQRDVTVDVMVPFIHLVGLDMPGALGS